MDVQLELLLLSELQLVECYLHWKRLHHGKSFALLTYAYEFVYYLFVFIYFACYIVIVYVLSFYEFTYVSMSIRAKLACEYVVGTFS